MNTQSSTLSEIAELVISSGKNAICNELRPLYRGVASFPHKETDEENIHTDGAYFYYSPQYILTQFQDNKNKPTRYFLHTLLHCIFLHVFKVDFKNRELWDLACDIFVEKTINDYNLKCTQCDNFLTQTNIITELTKHIKNFTAENIYQYFCRYPLSKENHTVYKTVFLADCHDVWYKNKGVTRPDDEELITVEASSIYKYADESSSDYQKNEKQLNTDTSTLSSEKIEEKWKDTTKRIIRDTEATPSALGYSSGFDTLTLKSVVREKYDYSDFLKKFIQLNETLEINDDEFDYIYYTYGLSLYDNIPLIEPLEYSENAKLQRLIIAIDTSGSIYGDAVKSFIKKTYSILMNTEFFKKEFEIHIVQCDCKIQRADILHSTKDLEEYINNPTLKGFGGTDFTPVFDYAEELINADKNKIFNGIIYFTDGDGIYPRNPPQFKNVFVIHDNGFDKNKMPVWATPLYIDFDY